ncbi:hypothetical protein [Streptomyces sp. NBC_00158]|uniref:hypothetical protein n=1 Tax=Streptomyces sp. NBC_00158 TaxID=2903627 RepID=UPI00324B206B
MNGVGWEETKRQAHERRAATGLPMRSAEQKRAAMERLLARVRAGRAAGGRCEKDQVHRA